MAQFRTHMSFGFILAVAGSIFLILSSLISNNFLLLPFSLAVLLGSMMPDLDSDEGFPFKITFWTFAVAISGIVFYRIFLSQQNNYVLLAGIPVATFFFIRFALGTIFKKITSHRGMFHSLPAAAIAGISVYLAGDHFPIDELTKQILALGVGVGYLGHLVLDEIYATINFNGKKFRPSKFLGSALKLYSKSKIASFASYALLAILFLYLFGKN